ncbi:MAG: dephospho-CoA kinase [Cytophagales bacterium]|nr:dephospho-CoA kinase [Cytophagales bacterium]
MATLIRPAGLLGLTGGIGSGKSTVAGILQRLGAAIVDADAISRSTTAAGGAAIEAIRAQFGHDFIDSHGALDRVKMRERVFSDARAKQQLESIIHPLVKLGMAQQIKAAQAAASLLIVLDLPLLAEQTSFSGWRTQLSQVCVVDCLPETQIKRVMARSGMTEAAVRAVMSHQASRQNRLAIADVVIMNDDVSLAELEVIVKTVIIKP